MATETPLAPHEIISNPWLAFLADERPPFSERLVRALEAHAAAEEESLSDYERLSELDPDGVTRLLMQLIVEDERRHHDLLGRMVQSLRDSIEWTSTPTAIPAPQVPDPAHLNDAVVSTRTLIREEREGARYLRHLARQDKALFGGLYTLLLETMARDSEKHERILRFLLKRLESRV